MNNCKQCNKEVKGNFPLCFECNKKNKENKPDFQQSKEYKPATEQEERMRLMLVSYSKDLLVGRVFGKEGVSSFLETAEKYIKTGVWKE